MPANMVSFTKQYFGFNYDRMPFGEVDSLILSQVIYYNYAGTGFDGPEFTTSLAEFLREHPTGNMEWEMPFNEDDELIRLLQMGGRHGNLKGCHFLAVKDDQAEKQFGALTFEIKPGLYYIAFRGTDNSVTGWKEDLNLSYKDVVPAQEEALAYAQKIMDQFEGEFYIGGHSKGGNLAVYSAMNLPEDYQQRIIAIYNHDGPGFAKRVYDSVQYKKIRPLIHKTIPESALIGLLWEEDDHFKVVKSKGIGLAQHITYTWLLENDHLIEVDDVDRFAKHMKKTLERWIEDLEPEERKRFIDSVFDAISKTEVERFQDLGKDAFRKIKLLFDGVNEMPSEEKKHVFQSLKHLMKITAEELKED